MKYWPKHRHTSQVLNKKVQYHVECLAQTKQLLVQLEIEKQNKKATLIIPHQFI